MLYKFISNNRNDKKKPDNWYFVALYLVVCGAICCMDSCTSKKNKHVGDSSSDTIKNRRTRVEKKSLVNNSIDSDTRIAKRGMMGAEKINSKAVRVASDAFEHGGSIPSRYTCDRVHGAPGDSVDVSPPLHWDGAPAGTQSIAVICQDPDAPMGLWVHWVVFNLSPETVSLPEKVVIRDLASAGTVQGVEGVNSWGKNGYGGPCPPDREHRYFFTVYMLNKKLELGNTATRQQVLAAINADGGRAIVAQGELMGRYEKKHGK